MGKVHVLLGNHEAALLRCPWGREQIKRCLSQWVPPKKLWLTINHLFMKLKIASLRKHCGWVKAYLVFHTVENVVWKKLYPTENKTITNCGFFLQHTLIVKTVYKDQEAERIK